MSQYMNIIDAETGESTTVELGDEEFATRSKADQPVDQTWIGDMKE